MEEKLKKLENALAKMEEAHAEASALFSEFVDGMADYLGVDIAVERDYGVTVIIDGDNDSEHYKLSVQLRELGYRLWPDYDGRYVPFL